MDLALQSERSGGDTQGAASTRGTSGTLAG